jgi:hypothetical protein
MGSLKPDTPTAPAQPNPYQVAAAQTGSNVTTGIANSIMGNASQTTPLGSSTTSISGFTPLTDPSTGATYNIPSFNQTQTLSPEQQTLYNQQTSLGMQGNQLAAEQLNRLNNSLTQSVGTSLPPTVPNLGPPPPQNQIGGTPQLDDGIWDAQNTQAFTGQAQPLHQDLIPFDAAQANYWGDVGAPQRAVGPTDYSADRQRVEEALYSRLTPELERERASMENTLVNQGFQRGTAAFNEQMDAYGRQANDARMQVLLAGGQEQSRLAGLDFQKFGLENQAQQQAFSQMTGWNQLENAARAQNNAARMGMYDFANNAKTQNFNNQVVANQATNAANQMAFDQHAQAAQFYNTAQQQGFDNNMARTGFNNQAAQQQYLNFKTNADYQATARERALQEQLALRNQPINEISALMNGGQVTMPQFTQFRPGEIAPNTLGQNVYSGYQTAGNIYNSQNQAAAASRAGMFNLGASILGAGSRMATGGMFGR